MTTAAYTAEAFYCNYDKGFCIRMSKRNPNGVLCSFHIPRVSTRVYKTQAAAEKAIAKILAMLG